MPTNSTDPHHTILDDLGLSGASPETKEVFANRMAEAVLKRVTAEALTKLSEDDFNDFEKLDTDDPDAIEQFLRSRIPEYDKIIEDAIADYVNEIKHALNENGAVRVNAETNG